MLGHKMNVSAIEYVFVHTKNISCVSVYNIYIYKRDMAVANV